MDKPVNVLVTNTHVPFLHLLCHIPNKQFFIHSYRFQNHDWQKYYRELPKNALHLPIDSPQLMDLYLHPDFVKQIGYIILNQFTDLEIFCNQKIQSYNLLQPIKKYFIFHNAISTEFRGASPEFINQKLNELRQIFQQNNITAVYISDFKAQGWQIPGVVIKPGIDQLEVKRNWTGRNISMLVNETFKEYSIRVCSNFEFRDFMNGFKIGNMILGRTEFVDLILGEGNDKVQQKNPNSIFTISQSYKHYLDVLAKARFMFSANNPAFEDWYNLSSLEAVALGVPLVMVYHNRMGKIENFNKQFPLVSDSPEHLLSECNKLFKDYEYAQYISSLSQDFIEKEFPLSNYIARWSELLRG